MHCELNKKLIAEIVRKKTGQKNYKKQQSDLNILLNFIFIFKAIG